ncbi:hypothetical protein FN846DRAFT_1022898 [Sphaerosporella brunnea]|uniref:Uncharacterized protein n=1 Tax=Sphaerosporella brunnea TaxID=1250544 RepID=A0A5J5ESN9_9PEZI|nr:hypothetical protein FN846DRAFT_1022898 [Sphaerosporella brunnea]
MDGRTYRAPGRRPKTAPVSIPAWSKSILMPTRDQLEFALEQAIGRDTMERLKNGEQVEITLLEGTSPATWHQGQFYAGHRSVHAFASMLIFARQDPVLWMVVAWVNGAFNVHAPPTNDGKKPDDRAHAIAMWRRSVDGRQWRAGPSLAGGGEPRGLLS